MSARLLTRLGVQAGLGSTRARAVVEVDAVHGITCSRAMASGSVVGDLLDLDAAFGRHHAEVLLGAPVEGEAGVVLLGDVRGVLDPEALDHVALDVETEDVAGVEADLSLVVGQLDTAGLAAATDLDLGLDHHRIAGVLGHGDRLLHRVGHAALGDGHVETGEVLLPLVFEEIHRTCSSLFLYCVLYCSVLRALLRAVRPTRAQLRGIFAGHPIYQDDSPRNQFSGAGNYAPPGRHRERSAREGRGTFLGRHGTIPPDLRTPSPLRHDPVTNLSDPWRPTPPPPSLAGGLVRLARPRQWIKNLLVFVAPAAAGVVLHWG